jgi:hypothetical protein
MLDRVLESISDAAAAEGDPRIEGRHMSVVVVPHKGKGAPKVPAASKADAPAPRGGEAHGAAAAPDEPAKPAASPARSEAEQ